jgi:hypothetical protein
MDLHGQEPDTVRQTIVTLFMSTIGVVLVLVPLVVLSGGYFMYLLVLCAGIVLFGAFHYVVWGRLLTQQTAGEREEETLLRRAQADDGSDQPEDRIRLP